MKKSLLFLLAPLSLALFGCSSSEDSLSSSEIPVSSSKIEQEVANINLAYSDMENALSNFFSEKSHGLRLSDLKEDVPSFLLSLKSKNTFDEIGKESKESDEIKTYSLGVYADDLSFKANALDSYKDFKFGLMAKSLLFDLEEKSTDTSLPFRQGFNAYFAHNGDKTGLYFDSSKCALTRALLENLYPDLTLYERSFMDLSNAYEAMESLFPLNKKAANLASFLRQEAQNLVSDGKGRFFTYEGEENTHFVGSYNDVSSFKETLNGLLDSFLEENEMKKTISSYLERLNGLDLSFEYIYNETASLSLDLNGSLSFKEDENGEGLSKIELHLHSSFLMEEESIFSLPEEVFDSSLWTDISKSNHQ